MAINTVNNQPAAVSPQPTDTLLAYQGAQSPQTRKMTAAQVVEGAGSAAITVAMTAWLLALPTAPSVTPGWWNNSGIPNYS